MRITARLVLVTLAALAPGHRASADVSDQVSDRIVENWRWSHYWFGKTGIDDVYAAGKQISALLFWTMNPQQPVRGLCSSELSLCIAYIGVYLAPVPTRMQMPPGVGPQQALTAFAHDGFSDASHSSFVGSVAMSDLRYEQRRVVLPILEPPEAILHREVPSDARREAERVARFFGCRRSEADMRPKGCGGSLVFAYYGEADPYWFVLRSCSATCEFKGESVEMLTRGDRHWEVTSGGYLGGPRPEVERFKQRIEDAAMFRLPL